MANTIMADTVPHLLDWLDDKRTGEFQYFVGLSVYSNQLHIVLSSNQKPGILVQYIPHSKLGNDPIMQYTLKELLGHASTQEELVVKQIASTPVLAEHAIPFLCNLMLPTNLSNEEIKSLVKEIQQFIQGREQVILERYHKGL
ncbi:hypothetical protein WA171_007224 [Blastocystis sp. BT1]